MQIDLIELLISKSKVFNFLAFSCFISVLSQKQIDVKSMLGVYIVLIVGIVLAFITLIAEIQWEKGLKEKVLNKFRR